MKAVKVLYGILYGFFTIFFIVYIGKFGLSNLVIQGNTRWIELFNIGIWFVLEMFCLNGFVNSLKKEGDINEN